MNESGPQRRRGDALLQARPRRDRRPARRTRPRPRQGAGQGRRRQRRATTACARSPPISATITSACGSASAIPATRRWCIPSCSAISPRRRWPGSRRCATRCRALAELLVAGQDASFQNKVHLALEAAASPARSSSTRVAAKRWAMAGSLTLSSSLTSNFRMISSSNVNLCQALSRLRLTLPQRYQPLRPAHIDNAAFARTP